MLSFRFPFLRLLTNKHEAMKAGKVLPSRNPNCQFSDCGPCKPCGSLTTVCDKISDTTVCHVSVGVVCNTRTKKEISLSPAAANTIPFYHCYFRRRRDPTTNQEVCCRYFEGYVGLVLLQHRARKLRMNSCCGLGWSRQSVVLCFRL